ncbi:hypothetical protein J4Q44_G00025630 [Coregonus suidteri]|uniref:Uncharacterized protein n=1 Tax=Coregonus suidteri TaxID=861788 RepID=A0AAN8MHG3_9TELE
MQRMGWGKSAVPSIPQVKDAPESTIYPRDEEELGEGDVYACTVEHTALKDPKTRFWEPEVSEMSGSSAGPAVFCGVGLTLGLLGVATGTFLIIKGNQCN